MSIFSKIKQYLGFGPDVDLSDPVFADSDGSPAASKPAEKPAAPEAKPVEFDPNMQDAIFAKVVEVFNSSLPSFLAESVDPAAQKRLLRQSLDEGVAAYLDSLKTAARDYCEEQWRARQSDMAAELDAIRLRAEDVERRSSDIRQKQLSADRQKRALTERVHDLESQLARLESEREQFELENRSLLNRLKVANVNQEDVEKLNSELTTVRAELLKLRENPELISKEKEDASNAKIAEMEEAVAAMKDQLRIADEVRDGIRASLKEAEEKIASRDKEIAELNELISEFDAATARMERSQAVIDEQNSSINTLKKEIAIRDEEIASLKNTIAENIKRQAEREQLLRNEIEELRPGMKMVDKKIDFSEEDVMPRISDDDLSAIEASFHAVENNASDDSADDVIDAPILLDDIDVDDYEPEVETVSEVREPDAIAAYNVPDDEPDDTGHRRRRNTHKKAAGPSDTPKANPNQLSLF